MAGTVADTIIDVLLSEGVTHVFGIPGAPLTALHAALRRSPIRYVLAKHENGAALMAMGYARMRRSLGVCFLSSAPDVTNALSGVVSAYAEGAPLLVISGQPSRQHVGKGAFQDGMRPGFDGAQLLAAATKRSTTLQRSAGLERELRLLIREALTAPTRPVHLSVPADLLSERVSDAPPVHRLHQVDVAEPLRLERAVQVLGSAQRLVILAGHGVNLSGAWEPLRALAERTSALVATTPKGKGAFPEHHPRSVGVFGLGGHERAEAAVLDPATDVLLVVGSGLGETASNGWDPALAQGRQLVRIDVDGQQIERNYAPQVRLVGDARDVLEQLLEQLPPRSRSSRIGRRPAPRRVLQPACTGLRASQVVESIRAVLPDDGVLVVDNGNSFIWGTHCYQVRRPCSYFSSLGFASPGSAIAMSVGVKLARPELPVIALVGDGAFAMSGTEVHTAVELGAGVIWIVLNDGGLGMIRHGETMIFGEHLGACEYGVAIDAAAMARALGVMAFRVASPDSLQGALRQSLRKRAPCVIDAQVDASQVPWPLLKRAKAVANTFRERPQPTPLRYVSGEGR